MNEFRRRNSHRAGLPGDARRLPTGAEPMTLSLKPSHLKRYRDILKLFIKYGHGDLVKAAELDEGFEETPAPETAAKAEDLAADLEEMGPTFIKLGQLLSTRTDLLPA